MPLSSTSTPESPAVARRAPLRRATVVTGAVAVSLLAAACTGSTGSGATSAATNAAPSTPSSAVATSPAATGTTTTTVPADGQSGGSGSTGGSGDSTGQCAESQLKASINFQHPAGTVNDQYHPVIVYFQNTSSTACTITGYPGAAVVDAQGKQVEEATRTIRGNALGLPVGQDTLPVVTLQPGEYASAGLEGVSTKETGAAQAGCSSSAYPGILVTPPNTTIPVPFTVTWPNCFTFEVHPVNVENNPPA